MLFNINDVLTDPLSVDIEVSGAELVEMALGPLGGKKTLGFSFLTPVSVHLDLSRLDENLIIVGSLKTTLGLQCGNCTKDFSFDLSSDFSHCMSVKAEETEKPDGPQDFEDALEAQSAHIEGGELNVTALVLEEISLEVPIKPLCEKDCKGLCPRCGADLNESKCDCAARERIDPRLAGLKEFKVRK